MDRKDYLRAKITVPQVLHQLLQRKSISAIINSTVLDEAVFFVAPFGYGKTLAVISWLRDCGKEAAWLTLAASDNAEPAFFAGLAAAMLRLAGWQGDVNDVLSDPKYIENQQDFLWEAILTAEKSACEKILVIDNFHFIKSPSLLRAIKSVISELLGRWRVIIMSRVELSPVFTELMLKRHVCLITLKELSFSPEEIADFFEMNGCAASQEDVLNIRNETEGWPASLNVVITLSRGGPVVYAEAARAYLMVFFETEIWNDLREDVKGFLLRTSILDKLTPAACRAVTDIGESLSLLQWLFANGLFISRLGEKDTYCYHSVFQSFLQEKLENSDIDKKSLYKKFGWWLFERNEIARSFSYFFKARDLVGVRQVLKLIDFAKIGLEGFLELAGCITELEVEDLRPYPEIVAKMALVHYLTGDVLTMQSLYRLLLEWDERGMLPISSEEYAEYMWEVGWLCFLDPDDPTYDPNNLAGGKKTHLEYANCSYYVPHLKRLQMSRLAVHSFPSVFRGMRDYGDDGIFYTESILKRAEEGEKHLLDDEDMLWTTYLIQAEYDYELERFTKAEEIIRRVMPLVEDRRYTYLYFVCTALLVKLARAVLDPGEIDALTKRLEIMILDNGHHFLLPNFHAFELRNRLAGGQPGLTEIFMEENRKYVNKPYFFLLYRQITYVRGLLSTGRYSEAVVMLGSLELLCHKYNRPTDLIEVTVLKAIALYGLGHEDSACSCLKKALKSAKRYGFIRIFSDDAKDIWPVLEPVRKQMSDKFIQNVVISCKKALARSGQKPPAKKFTHTELTKAERGILKTLQSGMSYAEIAQDNGVSLSTVKSHIHSIYSKLEVNNKTAAVIAAQNLGILR